jgi:AcrR family transcriptional regulator
VSEVPEIAADVAPDAGTPTAPTGRPAHRPSRRSEIVRAATNVFSRLTYAEATVEDIASECGVAPTAVYYHFGGKEELFDQAFESCLAGFSAMVDSVRATADKLDEDVLREVIYAGWAWWRTHPVEARFLTLHLNGATPTSRRLYEAWQERHAQRAFDYLDEDDRPPRSSRKAREQYAVRLLGFHFLGALLPISQTAWLEGSLSRLPVAKVEAALADILVPIMRGAGQPEGA